MLELIRNIRWEAVGRNIGFNQALIVAINARDYEVRIRQRMEVE